MMQAALFQDGPPFVRRRDEDGLLAWRCPHCTGETVGEPEETETSATADPACCLCRAEHAGLSFRDWRALPEEVRRQAPAPPAGWRSAVTRGEARSVRKVAR